MAIIHKSLVLSVGVMHALNLPSHIKYSLQWSSHAEYTRHTPPLDSTCVYQPIMRYKTPVADPLSLNCNETRILVML